MPRSEDSWVNDYLESQEHERKPEEPMTLEKIMTTNKKLDEIRTANLNGRYSKKDYKKLRQLEKLLVKQTEIYSNLGAMLRSKPVEGGRPILDPTYRKFRN